MSVRDAIEQVLAEAGEAPGGDSITKTAPGPMTIGFDRQPEDWPDAGVYQLWIELANDVRATVGRLGRFRFPAGLYVYTGRASRGLRARVRRHLGGALRKHWHIDFLLAKPEVAVVGVVLASLDADEECSVNQAIGLTGDCAAPGFGASDCRAGCTAHLWRCRSLPGGGRTWDTREQRGEAHHEPPEGRKDRRPAAGPA